MFSEWIDAGEKNFLISNFKRSYFKILGTLLEKIYVYYYLCAVRTQLLIDPLLFLFEKDFCEQDIEFYDDTHEILSELETKRIEVFQDFLVELKPLLRRGVIESFRGSADLQMTETELATIYMLLGYFSTATGKTFLGNLDDPELIQTARKLGDFTGLKKRIRQKEIRQLLSDITGIPTQSISNLESQKLLNLEATLHQRVIGQDEGISAIAKAIRRSRLGIQNPNRPIASFLFCGPTGVGKTEVTKALAVSMFGSESDMIRFDMSEFMEKFTVSRLIGSPPGYVGYDEGGQLTDSVRRKPYSVVLFDEIEKAHPDILNVLLQILEDGRLTDSQKRLVPFENTVIIMTSNAAAEEIQQIIKNDKNTKLSEGKKKKDEKVEEKVKADEDVIYQDDYAGAIAFLKSPITENYLTDLRTQLKIEFRKSFRNLKESEFLERVMEQSKTAESKDLSLTLGKEIKKDEKTLDQQTLKTLKSAVLERLSSIFLPEFLNRLDDIIIFQPLKPDELRRICDIMVKDVIERVKVKQIDLIVEDKVKTKLTREGYNPIFGARPLRRLITKYIEDLISEDILKTPITKKARTISIKLDENDEIIVQNKEEPEYIF
jgi:ATP-dependent Clp protease ATP-binding subunit ClpA